MDLQKNIDWGEVLQFSNETNILVMNGGENITIIDGEEVIKNNKKNAFQKTVYNKKTKTICSFQKLKIFLLKNDKVEEFSMPNEIINIHTTENILIIITIKSIIIFNLDKPKITKT
jgi:hypothetical protein